LQAVTLLLDHALSMCLTPFSPSLLRNGLIDRLDGSYAKKRFSPGLHKPYPKPRGARRRRREDKERDGEKICRWIAPPSLIFMMTEDTLLCLAGLGCFSLRPNILGIGHAPPQTPTNPHKPHKEEGRGPDKSLGSSQAPRTSQNTPTASFGE
jgi:hypothetical protein